MYRFYNAHPKGLLVADCVKRAISKACGLDYHEVSLSLNRYKKVTGAKKFNSDRNPEKWVENEMHGKRMSFPAIAGKPRMNGHRFCSSYPKGNYILQMAGHWTCCVNGIIYDTWDCSDKCVYKAWEIKPKSTKYKVSINYTLEMSESASEVKIALQNLIPKLLSGIENLNISVEEDK